MGLNEGRIRNEVISRHLSQTPHVGNIDEAGDGRLHLGELPQSLGTTHEGRPNTEGDESLHSMISAPNLVFTGVNSGNLGMIVSRDSERRSLYERVQYDEKTIQLIEGITQPYERVCYGPITEQMWKKISPVVSCEPYEHNSRCERDQ
jgi:hypothetical protein